MRRIGVFLHIQDKRNSSTPIKNMSMDSLKLNKVLNHVSLVYNY